MREKNTVDGNQQLKKTERVECFFNGGKINVLFVGNSITRHGPKKEIGWENDWGMAATKLENDYVHVAVKMLEERFGKVNYGIVNCGDWETHYYDDSLIPQWQAARDFQADIVVMRLGENIWNAVDKLKEDPLAPHYAKLVEYLSAKPNAKVLITGLFWDGGDIEKAVESVAVDKGYTFVRLCDLSAEKENMAIGQFWHEGVALHPSDLGMRRIAERIVAAL